jgi:lysophospholipase L1-like esterase
MRVLAFLLASGSLAWSQQDPAAALARAQKTLQDWPNLARYRADNEKVSSAQVVFMGDSITDFWGRRAGKFFPGKAYVNRGISGQTTPQMLIRFRPDVIALKPRVVVILAGTNDIGSNTGLSTLDMIEDNLMSMADLATVNRIRVVLSSVMPVCDYYQPQTQRRPPEKIIALNKWMKDYAAAKGYIFLDYYPAMVDDQGMLKKEYTADGLHPNDAGYEAIEPLAQRAIDSALKNN